MIEVLVALIAGLVGGLLSRYIPALPKKWRKKALTKLSAPGEHLYEVKHGASVLYSGSDLHLAKTQRKVYPGAVLIADGVNRG